MRHRGNTLALPECHPSCKDVAGKLQASCKLVGGFLFLSLPVLRLSTAAVQPVSGVGSRKAWL
jgi:hypothetical protein